MNKQQGPTIADVIKKIRQIEIKTNRLLSNGFCGVYKSIFKGQGIDFDELREYAIGDDPRFIDWNVSAKFDKPFIKKFCEERELSIMIVVDVSGSQSFGSGEQSKIEFSCEVASLLAFSAIKTGDKVGLTLFSNEIERYIQPKKGRQHGLRLIREILFYEKSNMGTNISGALTFVTNVLKRRSIIFFISDFMDDISNTRLLNILKITNSYHDLICIQITDHNEINLPQVGIATFVDSETDEAIELDTNDINSVKKIANTNNNKIAEIKNIFKAASVDSINLSTNSDYQLLIRKFLSKRIKRLRKC